MSIAGKLDMKYHGEKTAIGAPPTAHVRYYGYRNGVAVSFNDKPSAIQYSGSPSKIDSYTVNQDELNAYWAKVHALDAKKQNEWHLALLATSPFGHEVTALIYDAAYERGHSAGIHEVESYFNEGVDYTKRLFGSQMEDIAFAEKQAKPWKCVGVGEWSDTYECVFCGAQIDVSAEDHISHHKCACQPVT